MAAAWRGRAGVSRRPPAAVGGATVGSDPATAGSDRAADGSDPAADGSDREGGLGRGVSDLPSSHKSGYGGGGEPKARLRRSSG
jgi:hypothetical protein